MGLNSVIGIAFASLCFANLASSTCVWESDFGFTINCAFKKSGLFRVRNLGGIKGHLGFGFSLGDELGFGQSLTNLDPSRRRSVSVNGAPANVLEETTQQAPKQEKRGKQNRIMMRPQNQKVNGVNAAAMQQLSTLHRRGPSTMQPIIVAGPNAGLHAQISRAQPVPKLTVAKPVPMGVPPFRPLPKDGQSHVLPMKNNKNRFTPLQVPSSNNPGYQSESLRISQDQVSKMVSQLTAQNHFMRITPSPYHVETQTPKILVNSHMPAFQSMPNTAQEFIPMPLPAPPTAIPQSFSILTPFHLLPIPSKAPASNTFKHLQPTPNSFPNSVDPAPHQIEEIAYNNKNLDEYNSITGYAEDSPYKYLKEDINDKIAAIAQAGNISMEAVEAAILLRQQQLLNQYAKIPIPTSSTTTTSTTTEAPIVFQPEPEVLQSAPVKQKRYPTIPVSGKVMNAPREYYPVGYEKNFDDSFQSKVDLPDTNFNCGDQKYFPGLYADETLGCMVFHVCALTDDGLVMKSFLCPESTLFDQTILKCNWWFYVDCKSSRQLYDTNIPVSKSYQLMKALTYFSSYKKEQEDGKTSSGDDIEGIKEAISLLENQESQKTDALAVLTNRDVIAKPSGIQIVTAQKVNIHKDKPETVEVIYPKSNDTSPVYRADRELKTNTTEKPQYSKSERTTDTRVKFSLATSESRDVRRRQISRNRNVTTTETTTTAETTTSVPTVTTLSFKASTFIPVTQNRVITTPNSYLVTPTAESRAENITFLHNVDQFNKDFLSPVSNPISERTKKERDSQETAGEEKKSAFFREPPKVSRNSRKNQQKPLIKGLQYRGAKTNESQKTYEIDRSTENVLKIHVDSKNSYVNSPNVGINRDIIAKHLENNTNDKINTEDTINTRNTKPELALVKNEKVMIVRPTPITNVISQNPTPQSNIESDKLKLSNDTKDSLTKNVVKKERNSDVDLYSVIGLNQRTNLRYIDEKREHSIKERNIEQFNEERSFSVTPLEKKSEWKEKPSGT